MLGTPGPGMEHANPLSRSRTSGDETSCSGCSRFADRILKILDGVQAMDPLIRQTLRPSFPPCIHLLPYGFVGEHWAFCQRLLCFCQSLRVLMETCFKRCWWWSTTLANSTGMFLLVRASAAGGQLRRHQLVFLQTAVECFLPELALQLPNGFPMPT